MVNGVIVAGNLRYSIEYLVNDFVDLFRLQDMSVTKVGRSYTKTCICFENDVSVREKI
jgi:hypothetical protein